MKDLGDAFWRAAAYRLHPRVVLGSLLPLIMASCMVSGLGWFYWESAVGGVRHALDRWSLSVATLEWLDAIGWAGLRAVLAPLVVVALALPLIVMTTLLLVAWLMTPALVGLVAERRFATLQRRHGTSRLGIAAASLAYLLLAVLVLLVSLPLWLIPPVVLILPPLVWGWLSFKVTSLAVLAEHASREERMQLMQQSRWPLRTLGAVIGLLGAAPSLLWAVSALTLVFAPLVVLVSLWLYTLIFAFAALWSAHFMLAALQQLRQPSTWQQADWAEPILVTPALCAPPALPP